MTLGWQRLESRARAIIESIPADTIPVYCFLAERLKSTTDISRDYVFQFVFRSFYRIDNAGLTDEFKEQYFNIMQENRSKKCPDVKKICGELWKYKNLKRQNTIQFSFVTKLANALDADNFPIYDVQIATLFGFTYPNNPDTRFETYIKYYQIIRHDYQQAETDGALNICLAEFDTRFGEFAKQIPTRRKLDFICWAAGKRIQRRNAGL